jgi:hypothetical protein
LIGKRKESDLRETDTAVAKRPRLSPSPPVQVTRPGPIPNGRDYVSDADATNQLRPLTENDGIRISIETLTARVQNMSETFRKDIQALTAQVHVLRDEVSQLRKGRESPKPRSEKVQLLPLGQRIPTGSTSNEPDANIRESAHIIFSRSLFIRFKHRTGYISESQSKPLKKLGVMFKSGRSIDYTTCNVTPKCLSGISLVTIGVLSRPRSIYKLHGA